MGYKDKFAVHFLRIHTGFFTKGEGGFVESQKPFSHIKIVKSRLR